MAYPTGCKVYVVQTRTGGSNGKRVTVGRHGVITAEEASRRAALIVARIKAGEEPIPEPMAVTEAKGPTVANLTATYLKEVVEVRLKPVTAYSYRGVIHKHILPALGRIRLLLLTGCRKSEILNLRWHHVDLKAREMRLPDAKTGPRTVQLSPASAELLVRVPRFEGNPHVIPGTRNGNTMSNLQRHWVRIRTRAGLLDVRLHDCRHSFALRALVLGESLPMIGRLLGHSHMQTTARYAHLARDSVHEAAWRISDRIEAGLYRDCPEFAAAD